MTICTWIGGLSSHVDPNDANDPVNWVSGFIPSSGDTIAVGSAATMDLTNDFISGITIDASGATFNFSAAQSNFEYATDLATATPIFDDTTRFIATSTGAAVNNRLNISANFINAGWITSSTPVGSTLTISVARGYFYNTGLIEADAGNTIKILSGNPLDYQNPGLAGNSAQFVNAGLIFANGGSVLIQRQAVTWKQAYATQLGIVEIANGGKVEVSVAYDPNGVGYDPVYFFGDAGGNTLQIDNPASFGGEILNFQAGDTIDLGAALAITQIKYDAASGVLEMDNASGTALGSLHFISGAAGHASGQYQLASGVADGFHFATGGNGHTLLTTTSVGAVFSAGSSGYWQSVEAWANGAVPGATSDVVIGGLNALDTFTLTTGSAPVTVASISLLINGGIDFQITSLSYVTGAGILDHYATIEVTSGNSLTTTELVAFNSSVLVDAASTLALTGRPTVGLAAVNGVLAVDTNNLTGAVITGATMQVAGTLQTSANVGIAIDAAGSIAVENGVATILGLLANNGFIQLSGAATLTAASVSGSGTIGFQSGAIAKARFGGTSVANTITGFAATDEIDLAGIGFDATDKVRMLAGNVLEIDSSNGVAIGSLHFSTGDNFAGQSFVLALDSTSGGTRIKVQSAPPLSAPTIALTSDTGSSATDRITRTGALTLSGVVYGSTVEYSTNNGLSWSSSFTASEGANTVEVRQTVWGVTSAASAAFAFTLDTSAPTAPTIALTSDTGSSPTDKITSNGALTLGGVETGATVQYSTDGGATWTSSFTATQGVNSVQVRQIDVAGNISVASTAFAFTLDTSAPTLAITSAGGATNRRSQIISGTIDVADAGLTISIYDGNTLIGVATPALNGAWTTTVNLLAGGGAHNITAKATDAAGNTGASATIGYSLIASAAHDFNGDGTTDVLLENASTGIVGSWEIVNNTPTWAYFSAEATGWRIAGVGDYNGDGNADILLSNSSTGQVGEWLINNNTPSWHSLSTINPGWTVS